MTKQVCSLGFAFALCLGVATAAPLYQIDPSIITPPLNYTPITPITTPIIINPGVLNAAVCNTLKGKADDVAAKLATKQSTWNAWTDSRDTKKAERRNTRNQKLAEMRTKQDTKRTEGYTKIDATMTSEDDKSAAAVFKSKVEAAVVVRRGEIDAAIADYRAKVDELMNAKVSGLNTATTAYAAAVGAAVSTAKTACDGGANAGTTKTILKNSLHSARIAYKDARADTLGAKSEVQSLAAARKQKVATAIANFKVSLEAARAEFKASLE
jgi:hypothetical protein